MIEMEEMTFSKALSPFFKTTAHYKDIYSVIESVSWIWRGTGILIVVPGPVGHRKYTMNKFMIGYTFVITFLFISSYIGNIRDPYIHAIVKDLGLDVQVHMFIRQNLNCISMLNWIIWKIITIDKFIEATTSLEKQDRILNKLGCQLNYRSSSIKIAICVRSYFIATFLLTLHEFYFFGANFSMLIDWVVWWMPIIIHKVGICLYLTLVWIIGVRFNALNKKLDFIAKSTSFLQLPVSRHYISIIRSVGNVHGELCKIGQSLNFIFLISLITTALEAFVFMTLILFSLILEVKRWNDLVQFLTSASLLFICTFPMITIVMICNWTKKQASAAVNLIHKIKVQENDNILSDMIQIFSMQTLHQKVSFSVGGFFTLDPSLLQSITAVITSYLIILIQFGQMDNILLNKS